MGDIYHLISPYRSFTVEAAHEVISTFAGQSNIALRPTEPQSTRQPATVEQLQRQMLDALLETDPENLTKWEQGFIESLDEQLANDQDRRLTTDQIERLQQIYKESV